MIINEFFNYMKMFERFKLYTVVSFTDLATSIQYEDITNGRKGAVLIDEINTEDSRDNDSSQIKLIPIVRTTTVYQRPAQKFQPYHYSILKSIKDTCKYSSLDFNNALIEIYDDRYKSMGYHTDQALDLNPDSYIAIFSCYETESDQVSKQGCRKLVIKEKDTGIETEIILEHLSVLLFSVETNSKYIHKIILNDPGQNNRWLGVTYRLSKTLIRFIDEIPYFKNGQRLTLANKEERNKYYKCRSLENARNDYTYPEITYTISISDTYRPI